MGYNKQSQAQAHQAPALVVMVLILFAGANPLDHGQPLERINVVGRLCCTANGNCPGGPGIPGVVVSLNCSRLVGGTSISIGQNTTNATGFFNINVLSSLSILGNILPLPLAVVQLPLNQTICPILSTSTGFLVGFLNPIITAPPIPGVFGLVRYFNVPLFSKLTFGIL